MTDTFVDGFKAFKDNISVRSCLSYTYSLTGGSGKDIKDEPLTAKVTRSILLLDSVPYRPRLMDSRIGIFPTIKKEYSATKRLATLERSGTHTSSRHICTIFIKRIH